MGMNPPEISWVFAVIIFVICALLVTHIIFKLWKRRILLRELNEQHRTIVHSLPMSLGMISTMTICMVVGAILSTNISAAYIVGLLVGLIVSGSITLPFQDEIALLDGVVSGSMGGLMGVMVGVMTPATGLYTVITLLTALFIITWIFMDRRILTYNTVPSEAEHPQNSDTENMREVPDIYEWQEWIQQQVKSAIASELTAEHPKQNRTNDITDKVVQKQPEMAAKQKANQL